MKASATSMEDRALAYAARHPSSRLWLRATWQVDPRAHDQFHYFSLARPQRVGAAIAPTILHANGVGVPEVRQQPLTRVTSNYSFFPSTRSRSKMLIHLYQAVARNLVPAAFSPIGAQGARISSQKALLKAIRRTLVAQKNVGHNSTF